MAALDDDIEEQQAQRIALTQLIRGCDGAVSEFLHTMSQEGEISPAATRAREILAELLASWRQALTTLARST